ncbi:MAG: hypothetical protein HYR96_14330 [Deltaproteobacteria bacterium]|nr:hypothetical protein [Deltaproteobacteria bacterium]MBI3293689.1 hypothetical protein [Deltaproteobacteria bacterium]
MNPYSLSVDYSDTQPSLALNRLEGEKIGALVAETLASDHALETMLPSIDELLTKFGLGLIDIGLFVTTSGPGSFTGLRSSYASLKALARVHGQTILAVACDEVRALSWIEMTGRNENVLLATQMGKTKAVLSTYRIGEGIVSRALIESTANLATPILTNETILFGVTADNRSLIHHPSRASDSARYASRAKSRILAKGAIEIATLEPDYYGDKWAHPSK